MGEGIVRDGRVHTAILKWIINKDLLYSTCNSVQCYEGSLRENGSIYVYGCSHNVSLRCSHTVSLRCSPENITTILICYTPKQNKNLKKNKDRSSLVRKASINS